MRDGFAALTNVLIRTHTKGRPPMPKSSKLEDCMLKFQSRTERKRAKDRTTEGTLTALLGMARANKRRRKKETHGV